MKKFICLLGASLLLSSASIAQGYLYNYVKGFVMGLGYNIRDEYYCDLKEGGICTTTFKFYKGSSYKIVAFSEDEDVQDVDLEIVSLSGTVLYKDSSPKDLAVVGFSPSYDRSLKVRVKNYDSDTPYYKSRVRFIIAYK